MASLVWNCLVSGRLKPVDLSRERRARAQSSAEH